MVLMCRQKLLSFEFTLYLTLILKIIKNNKKKHLNKVKIGFFLKASVSIKILFY